MKYAALKWLCNGKMFISDFMKILLETEIGKAQSGPCL
jgi:hypothetical protein